MCRIAIIILVLLSACQAKKQVEKQQYLTSVIIAWDTARFELTRATSHLEGKGLKVNIEEADNPTADIAIEIVLNDSIELSLFQPWSMTDCTYINRRFQLLTHQVTFDKKHFVKGDTLYGKLDAVLLGHHDYFKEPGEMKLREDWDTVLCRGVFSTIVR